MKYLIAIDDTDMPGTIGTGQLMQNLGDIITKEQWGECSNISRHQLFVHDDIPYTSHNSSMCFDLNLMGCSENYFLKFCSDFLKTKSARGSDPGLCMAKLESSLNIKKLISFGLKAKTEVLFKSEAYNIAKKTNIHLSEHGGTGDGVIGALAGIGLRLSGSDGRYRGWYHFGKIGDVVTVGSLCSHDFVDQVSTIDGNILDSKINIIIGSEKTKTIRIQNKQIILVRRNNDRSQKSYPGYQTITKQEAKTY